MKTHILFPAIIALAVILLTSMFYFSRGAKTTTLTVHENPFRAYVADTAHLREVGLGGRKSLGENEAMLFVFDTPHRLGFWMKDMLIPVDMIWLDSQKKVVQIMENVTPDTYPTVYYGPNSSQYVVEVSAHNAGRIGIQVGDVAEWEE